MDAYIAAVLFLLFGAFMATLVRMRDKPITALEVGPFVITFASSLIAAVIVLWMLVSSNYAGSFESFDFASFANFVIVAGTAVGGIAFVNSILSIAKPSENVEAPKA